MDPSNALNARKPGQQQSLDPTRTPLPLTASQEAQVRELYYKRVRTKCADEVRGMWDSFALGQGKDGGFQRWWARGNTWAMTAVREWRNCHTT